MSKLTRATVPMCSTCGSGNVKILVGHAASGMWQCLDCGGGPWPFPAHGYYDNAKEVVREMREFYDAEEVIDLDIVASWMDRLDPGKGGDHE